MAGGMGGLVLAAVGGYVMVNGLIELLDRLLILDGTLGTELCVVVGFGGRGGYIIV